MKIPTGLYTSSLALLTDLYELTMACALWKNDLAGRETVFHLFFRRAPFKSGYTVACGLAPVVDLLSSLRFDGDDLAYLRGLGDPDGRPLFEPGFLDLLGRFELACDVDAVPEGTVVYPHEPLVRVRGPVLQCQILETALLNIVNFQTLIATKAARICQAARGDPVLEFGLRRAQGIDGALAASRAAYVGGCAATSNVLAGKIFGIPVRGTHAHSWVMLFDEELEAFEAYARAMPGNCVFLVDTYDTLQGVRHAVAVGRRLADQGHRLLGIRLDSGDLATLSIEARRILDEAGFADARIVASNDLDEHIIASLKEQGATIGVWGVGTRLVTAHDEPALGGVYKLAAVRTPGGAWRYTIKLSEQALKVSTPGVLQVRRFSSEAGFIADAIYDIERPPAGTWTIVDPADLLRTKEIPPDLAHEDLLVPVFRGGRCVIDPPPLEAARQRAKDQISRLHSGVRRLVNPHAYPAGLELSLHEHRTLLARQAPRRGPEGRPT